MIYNYYDPESNLYFRLVEQISHVVGIYEMKNTNRQIIMFTHDLIRCERQQLNLF